MHMIQLQRVYFTSEFCKQYSFRLKVVCDLIEHSLHLSFLFSVLGCGVFPLFLCSYLYTNLCSHFPVASIAAISSFDQRQENICHE